jgi:diguanylate cyclase (GGDEF)-like protein
MKILLVEDDNITTELLVTALTNQYYTVDVANDGQMAWQMLELYIYDLILLDVILPNLDGISICRQLRTQGNQIPILILTGDNTAINRVNGLDAGADDYVTKPFDLNELLARIRALLRRGNLTLPQVLRWGELRLDPNKCQVTWNHQNVHLTPKEYGLLELFLRHNHRVFSCNALIEHLWSFEEIPSEDTVRSHLKGLRTKLRKAGVTPEPIETVYGMGYRLKPPQEEDSQQVQSNLKQQESERTNSLQLTRENIGEIPNALLEDPVSPLQPAVIKTTGKVLVVDEDTEVLNAIAVLLESRNLQVVTLNNSASFWDVLAAEQPDLLVMDIEIPAVNGFDICQSLRNDPLWRNLPILLLTVNIDAQTIHRVFAAGADDLVCKPIVGPELVSRVLNRLERIRLLRNLTEIDTLTGVSNRPQSTRQMLELIESSQKKQKSFSFAVVTVDRLKQINNHHGHAASDRVLFRLAQLLRQASHDRDIIGRWGGKEFVLAMPEISQATVVVNLSQILENFRQIKFIGANHKSFYVTFRAAVVEYPCRGNDLRSLYQAADTLLQQAKAKGRNRILSPESE